MLKGRLFVISGPSAVGKGTIVDNIIKASDDVSLSVSATTRAPRDGETEGVSYFFMSEEEFKSKIDEGGFLEYANVHGNYYGTPKAPVEECLSAGRDVILEIDVQGAMQVMRSYGGAIGIFILPPSIEELRSRIENRGTESAEDIELRMSRALDEIGHIGSYDYFVVNDDLREAVDTVRAIMTSERCRTGGNAEAAYAKLRGNC